MTILHLVRSANGVLTACEYCTGLKQLVGRAGWKEFGWACWWEGVWLGVLVGRSLVGHAGGKELVGFAG